MPRIHTQAVSWNSGVPTRLPRRSSGPVMPESAWQYSAPCRNMREVKTGRATKGEGSVPSPRDRTYEESDISATSNSRCRIIRKKVSSTGSRR